MDYIVRADYYPNGEIVPLGITDHNGNTLYLNEMEMIRTPGINNFRFVCLTSSNKKIIVLLSSNIELTTLIASNSIKGLEHVVCYEILPLGNKKRREIISKWYHLNETYMSEEDISNQINNATEKINTFLGNGNGNAFIPASPIFILGALQNIDAVQQQFGGSKFGYLYETLIISSLLKISGNYSSAGNYDIDIGILSNLAYKMLQEKRTGFTTEQIEKVVEIIDEMHRLGMRSIQAIIDTMGFLENDLIEYVFERASKMGKRVRKEEAGQYML